MKTKIITAIALMALVAYSCKKNEPLDKSVPPAEDTVVVQKDSVIVAKQEPMVPGKSLGITSIGDATEAAISGLGTPISGDAAMGKSLATYKIDDNGDDATVSFFSSRNASENQNTVQIQMMRTDAKKFRTENNMGVGSSRDEIQKSFALDKSGTFKKDKETFTLYDTNAGIAFEFNKENICTGVVIHAVDKQAGMTYLPFYENFKK